MRASSKAKLIWALLALPIIAVAGVTKSEWSILLILPWMFLGYHWMDKYPDTFGD